MVLEICGASKNRADSLGGRSRWLPTERKATGDKKAGLAEGAVECLPGTHEVLSSSPSAAKNFSKTNQTVDLLLCHPKRLR